MSIEVIASDKGKPMYRINGFMYEREREVLDKKTGDIRIYLRCNKYRAHGCKLGRATVILKKGESLPTIKKVSKSSDHTHKPSSVEALRKIVRNKLKDRIMQEPFKSIRQVYDEVAREYTEGQEPESVDYMPTFDSLKSVLARHRIASRTTLLDQTPEASSEQLRYIQRSAIISQHASENVDYHTIITDKETAHGTAEKLEFQAETRMLLDIVAKSLYSDKEVFIRELVSNASDALEKLRHAQIMNSESIPLDVPHEIHIALDKQARKFVIQDTGIGMTKEEMISSLGTIARSGSKAFLEELKKSDTTSCATNQIIGQFGVGFYSTFMVSDKVEVYSKSHKPDSKGYKWTSDGSGTYEIMEAEGVNPGTKIVVYLKSDCREFADEDLVRNMISKYSNFVSSPIFVSGKRANNIQALWLMDPKDTTPEMHNEFYRYIANTCDIPRYCLHYKTDSPLNLRCLLYIPEGKPGLFETSRDLEIGVALYSQRVLIRSKADILPKWLRFIRGVVDSEDIPLNLSRELLQDSALIRKISTMITNKLLRFLQEQMKKDIEEYMKFHDNYSIFLKEGILTIGDQVEKEDISKLLLFESSLQPAETKTSLSDYVTRMKEGQKDIYFLAAPSRQLAEMSPYYEAVKQKDVEVIFCYEPYDELVLFQLRQFNFKNIISVEKEMRREKEDTSVEDLGSDALPKSSADTLLRWLSSTLGSKVHKVKVTKRLSTHPCLISVEEMSAARHYIRTSLQSMSEEQRYKILEPTLELNLSHPIIKKLSSLQTSNPKLAELLAHQVFDAAMVSAGLVDDPRKVTTNLNELLVMLLEKH